VITLGVVVIFCGGSLMMSVALVMFPTTTNSSGVCVWTVSLGFAFVVFHCIFYVVIVFLDSSSSM